MKQKKSKIRVSPADRGFDILNYVILTFCLLIVAYPLYFIVIASVSDPTAVYSGKVILWPARFTLEGYQRILDYESFFTGYRNTVVYTVVGTAINVLITIPGAYALSRKDLIGRNILMMGVTFTMIFSGGLIPTYLLVISLNLYNTMWALILPAAVSAWNLIVARTFFQETIPDELLEAATLDGATEWQIFTNIALPLCKNAIFALTILLFIDYWNMVEQPLVLLTDVNKQPLSVFLSQINEPELGIAFAASSVYMIPPLLIFFWGEEYLVEGISRSGIK